MKKTKIGQVMIKLNDKGHAKETYAVTDSKWDDKKQEWVNFPTGEKKEKNIYCMAYQPKKRMFKGTNNYFNPETFKAVSYDWWCYVKKIKGKVVFNNCNYSMTTCGHQSEMRRLLDQLGIKVYAYVNMRDSLEQFESSALKPLYAKMFALEIEMSRKNSRKDKNKERLKSIATIKKDIEKLKKLGAKFSKDDAASLKASMLNEEARRLVKSEEEKALKRELDKNTRVLQKSGEVFDLSSLNNV